MDGNTTENTNVFTNAVSSEASIALMLLLGIFDVVSIVANGMVLITVYVNPRLRSNTNFFITNLCLVDLISGLVLMPLVIDSIGRQEARFGALCKLVGFIDASYSCASSLTIAVIALDRYHSIVNCLYYENIVTRRRTIIAIVWIWFQTLFIALCPIAGWGKYSFDFEEFKCSLELPDPYGFLWFMFCTSVVLPFIIIVFCYTQIHLVARRHAKNMVAIHIHDTGKRIKAVSTRKTKLVYLVVGLYSTCWLPIYIVKLLKSVLPGIGIPTGVITLAMVLSLVNGSCNPFLYALITSQYRAGMNRMHKRFRRKFGRNVATPSVDQSKSSWSVSRPISNLYRYFQENDAGNMLACIRRTYGDDDDRNESRADNSQKHLNPKNASPSPSNQRKIKPQTLQIPHKAKNEKKNINGWVEGDKNVKSLSIPLKTIVSQDNFDDKHLSCLEVSSECKFLTRSNSLDRKKTSRAIKDRNSADPVRTVVRFKSQNYLEVLAVSPDSKSNWRTNNELSKIEEVDKDQGHKLSEVDLCRKHTTWEDESEMKEELRTRKNEKEMENIGMGEFKSSASDEKSHMNMMCENNSKQINLKSVNQPLDKVEIRSQQTPNLVTTVKDLRDEENIEDDKIQLRESLQ